MTTRILSIHRHTICTSLRIIDPLYLQEDHIFHARALGPSWIGFRAMRMRPMPPTGCIGLNHPLISRIEPPLLQNFSCGWRLGRWTLNRWVDSSFNERTDRCLYSLVYLWGWLCGHDLWQWVRRILILYLYWYRWKLRAQNEHSVLERPRVNECLRTLELTKGIRCFIQRVMPSAPQPEPHAVCFQICESLASIAVTMWKCQL